LFGGILMVVAISVFVLIHEAGHFLAARATGMKATEFFLGFGPRIWSFRRGETEFGVKAIPLGGYVRIAGMNDREWVHPDDIHRTYREQVFWKKSVVVLSGVTLNMLMAFLLLFGLFWVSGSFEFTTTVGRVSPETSEGIASPAAEAGLRDGDTLVAIDGVVVDGWDHAVSVIMARPGKLVTIDVLREGNPKSIEVTLGSVHPSTGEATGFLGVSPSTRRIPVGPVRAASLAAGAEWSILTGTLEALARIVRPESLAELGGVLAGRNEVSDAIRPVSPIGLVQIGTQVARVGIGNVVFLLAVVNVTLAIFNSLPLYPLDGGHFAVALYEKVTRRRVDARRLIPVAVTVVMLMVFLGLVAVVLDIVDPLTL